MGAQAPGIRKTDHRYGERYCHHGDFIFDRLQFYPPFSWIIYLLAVGLLALVLVAGDSSKGAQRWFEIGGIRFQPSELVKILLILFFAYYFMKYEEKINTVRVIVSSFVLLAIPLFLIYKQPNLSTMIVITLVFAHYYLWQA